MMLSRQRSSTIEALKEHYVILLDLWKRTLRNINPHWLSFSAVRLK